MRSWLGRRVASTADVEDVIQECYCRLAQLRDVSHIAQPRAYFFTMARNLVQQQLKAARVVRLEDFADRDGKWESDEPSPERVAAARLELRMVHAALRTLSDRAQRIFIMRRIEGLAQKEIAERLDVSENIVENEASRSLRAILRLMTEPEPPAPTSLRTEDVGRARSH